MRSSRSIAALAAVKTDFSSVKAPPVGIIRQPQLTVETERSGKDKEDEAAPPAPEE